MHPDKDNSERFRKLFDAPIDWDYLITAARYHRFIPFLFNSLKSIPETQVPSPVLKEVSQFFYNTVEWNLLKTAELFSIVDKLKDKGISSIPFKGPVLAQILYGDISHRQFDDLDILIPRKDFHKIKEFLIAEGYQPELQVNLRQESMLLRSRHHFQFFHPRSKFYVEIHWEFSPALYSFNLHLAEVWCHRQTVGLLGRDVVSLAPSDMLLVLCEHGSRHYWKRLQWISDVARLIELKGIDWPFLERQARDIGSERDLLLGISLAKALFNPEVPALISQKITDNPEVLRLTNLVLDKIYSKNRDLGHITIEDNSPDIEEELFYIHARERLRDRIRYYVRRATSPSPREDLNFFVLPKILWPLYPIIRIGQLLKKYKLRIWKWI